MDLPDSSLLLNININLGDGPTKSNKQSYGNDKVRRLQIEIGTHFDFQFEFH